MIGQTIELARHAYTLAASLRSCLLSPAAYEPLARGYIQITYQLADAYCAAGYHESAGYWVEQMHITTMRLHDMGIKDDALRGLTLAMQSVVLAAGGSLERASLVAAEALKYRLTVEASNLLVRVGVTSVSAGLPE